MPPEPRMAPVRRIPTLASATKPAEISALQPARDRPSTVSAAWSQRTTATWFNCLRKSATSGGAVTAPEHSDGPGQKLPFDPDMIEPQSRAGREREQEHRESCQRDAMLATAGREGGDQRDRHSDIVGDPLAQAELAGRVAEALEQQGASDHDGRGDRQKQGQRPGL